MSGIPVDAGIAEAASRGITEGLAAAEEWTNALRRSAAAFVDYPGENAPREAPQSIQARGIDAVDAYLDAYAGALRAYYSAIRPAMVKARRELMDRAGGC